MLKAGIVTITIVSNLWLALLAGAVPPAATGAAQVAPAAPPAAVAPASPGAGPWKALASSGRVEALPPTASQDGWTPLRRGRMVAALSHVRTFERARTTLTRNGDLILVSAGSEVVLPDEAPDGATVVLQKSGRAVYKVASRAGAGGRFEVRTPLLVAGVKGTKFSVILEEDRAAVSVEEGVVEVRSSLTGETRDLTAGEVAIVDRREDRMHLQREEVGERRGRDRGEEKARAAAATCGDGVSCEDADLQLFEVVREESDNLLSSLETDETLFDTDTELDLWGDLGDDTTTLTRTAGGLLARTTSALDPQEQDLETDTSLLDLIPFLLGRK